jgi:glycine betaine catabolism B
MWDFDTEFFQVVQRSPTVKSFRFSVPDLDYKAGQFFFVTIKVNGENAVHHFSFSCSPTDKGYIEFTKRITQSPYSQVLNVVKQGDWAHLRGPAGSFTLPEDVRPLAFIAGGIGVTPLRGMLRFIVHEKLPFNVKMLYGCPNTEEIIFRDELDEMAKSNPNITIDYALSGPDFPPGWPGKKGFISKDLISETIPDYKDRAFYISGPPKMVTSLMDQVKALGVPEGQIKHDSFTGYD